MTKLEHVVYMTQQEFDELLTYNSSLPTGTTLGKTWKCDAHSEKLHPGGVWRRVAPDPRWRMGEYVHETKEPWKSKGYVGIKWRDIVIGKPEDCLDYQI